MPLNNYDPTDPFGLRNGPFGRPQTAQGGQLPPLSSQEEESLLGKIGGKVLGGLGWVGDVLDKYTGGRAVRGLLGGKPQELLSVLPFSDALGVTDEKNKVTGRDLTDQWGISDKGSSSWGDAGLGIGADILLNPTTYLSFGGSALTDAGKAAAKIGALPETHVARMRGLSALTPAQEAKAAEVGLNAADLVNKPLGGLANVGFPFLGDFGTIGASEGTANALESLGRGMSTLGSLPGVRHVLEPMKAIAEPVGRHLNALFNYKVAGATSAAGQKAGRAYTSGVEQSLNSARGLESGLVRGLDATGQLDNPSLLRQVGEAAQGSASSLGAEGRALNTAADQMKAHLNELDQAGADLGFAAHKLADPEAEYLPRHMAQLDKNTAGYGRQQAMPLKQQALNPREEVLKNVPGGTESLNRLSVDPEFSGIMGRYGPQGSRPAGTAPTTPLTRAELIRAKYLGVAPEDEARIGQVLAKQSSGAALTADEAALAAKFEQSKGLESWAASLDPKYLESQTGYFGNHPVEDFMRTAASKIRRNEAGKAVHDLLADTVATADKAGPGWVRLDKALEHAGFDDLTSAGQAAAGRLGGKFGAAPNLTELYVPPDVLRDAQRFLSGFTTPDALKPIVGAIDYVTNLTKAFQTALWPGFHARNFVSGMWQNFVLGAHDPAHNPLNPTAWAKPVLDAQKVLRGGTIEGAADIPYLRQLASRTGRTLTDEEATQELANLAHQYRAVSGGVHQASELTGPAQAANLRSRIPGMDPYEGFLPNLKEALPTSGAEANPLNLAGVGANKDLFAPIAAGRKFGTNVEDTNRLSAFIGKLRQGFHPEEAAAQVRAAHVDYSALSDFEKNVMRRVIPFYTYSRGTFPHVLEQMLQRPGGLGGQLAMATDELRGDKNRFLPEYLGGGLAIPTGKEQDGKQRFLTRIDTPVENLFDKLHPSLSDTMLGVLGETNPLLKGPLEMATGKQFMSGRDLADLYPMTGSTAADQLLMNSPAGRFASAGRTLADPNKDVLTKGLNLMTGMKLSDVDLEKARDMAGREALADALRGQQGVGRYETFYARPEQVPNLTPEEVMMLRLQKTLDERAKQRAKAQRVGVGR